MDYPLENILAIEGTSKAELLEGYAIGNNRYIVGSLPLVTRVCGFSDTVQTIDYLGHKVIYGTLRKSQWRTFIFEDADIDNLGFQNIVRSFDKLGAIVSWKESRKGAVAIPGGRLHDGIRLLQQAEDEHVFHVILDKPEPPINLAPQGTGAVARAFAGLLTIGTLAPYVSNPHLAHTAVTHAASLIVPILGIHAA